MSITIESDRRLARQGGQVAGPITELASLAALAEAWQHPASPGDNPIASLDWALAAARTVDRSAPLHVLSRSRNGQVRAVAPFVRRRRRGIDRLLLAGSEQIYEPGDLLALTTRDLRDLGQLLARQPYPIELIRLPAESPTVAVLRESFAGRGLVVHRPVDSCAYIPLGHNDSADAQESDSTLRNNLRRAERRARKLGGATTEILTPRPVDLDSLLNEAFAIEARSWKRDSGTALALDRERGAFFREYAQLICRRGTLRLAFLSLAGVRVATQIAMEHAGGWWALKMGYDGEYRQYSPGALLWRDTIRYSEMQGLDSFEFLGIFDPWKRDWTSHERRCISLRAYPRSALGLAALVADGGASLVRRLTLPPRHRGVTENADGRSGRE